MSSGTPAWDAIVVGSGPAGATAARHLARGGSRVLILEKQSWPRYKTCGGGLVARTRRLLDIGIDEAIEVEAHRAEIHLWDADAEFTVDRDDPLVSMTMRSQLDDVVTSAALRAGAQSRTECGVSHVERQEGTIAVAAGDEIFHTRFLIVADGAAGPSAALAGWPPHPRLIPALESEIDVDPDTYARFVGIARFDFGVIPAGYAWIFPKAERLSVGCLSYNRRRPDLKRHLHTYLQSLEISPRAQQSFGFVIPVAPRARRLAEGGVLLTGDAAGLVDPVTCEGISHAILSGQFAAQAILDRPNEPEGACHRYQQLLSSSVLPELRAARLLAGLLYQMPRIRRLAFRRVGHSLAEVMVDVISGELTYRQLVSSPSRYLRAFQGMMRRPGAYPNG
jgi:geranylgeranyl reductase family protein